MEPYDRPSRWAAFLAAILVAAVVGFFAYNAGVAHGIAGAAQQVAAPAPGTAVFPPYAYPYYRPWGFGFGFFFAPFFFFLLFVFVIRGLVWGRRWRHGYGCGGGYYGAPSFDEWHRRAHERMTQDTASPPRDDNRSRG